MRGLPHRSQLLQEKPAPAWALHGYSSCQENPLLHGALCGCSVDSCCGVVSSGCMGKPYSSTWNISSPPSLPLAFTGLFLTLFPFVVFLKCIFTQAPPALLMGSAVPCRRFIGVSCDQHMATLGHLPQRSSCSPLQLTTLPGALHGPVLYL